MIQDDHGGLGSAFRMPPKLLRITSAWHGAGSARFCLELDMTGQAVRTRSKLGLDFAAQGPGNSQSPEAGSNTGFITERLMAVLATIFWFSGMKTKWCFFPSSPKPVD